MKQTRKALENYQENCDEYVDELEDLKNSDNYKIAKVIEDNDGKDQKPIFELKSFESLTKKEHSEENLEAWKKVSKSGFDCDENFFKEYLKINESDDDFGGGSSKLNITNPREIEVFYKYYSSPEEESSEEAKKRQALKGSKGWKDAIAKLKLQLESNMNDTYARFKTNISNELTEEIEEILKP